MNSESEGSGASSDPGVQMVNQLLGQRKSNDARLQPMTFDLEDMAILALNAYTRGLDENSDYLLWMSVYYDRRPLCQRHTRSDGNQMPKYAEGIALTRLMTGSTLNNDKDEKIWKWLDGHTAEDGLLYKLPNQADAYGNGRAILARILDYRLTGSEKQRQMIEKAIDTLWNAVYVHGDRKKRDSYCTFPRVWDGGSQVLADTAGWPIYNASIITAMANWYELTDNPKALDLAGWTTNSILRGGEIAEDGGWVGWFHPFVHAGLAMLKYALVTDNKALCQRMRGFYESGRQWGTSYGFFPEVSGPLLGEDDIWVSRIGNEGCCTADMVCMAGQLSQAGLGDYWDDVDRYLRNQLTEIQMKRTGFLDRIPANNIFMMAIRPEQREGQIDDFTRYIGSLAGWAGPNDFAGPAHLWLQQCCLGNAGRAIYAGFQSIVSKQGDMYKVNLPINRSTKQLDVDSYLPWEGKVVVNVKEPVKLAVRMPEFVSLENVVAKVNGQQVDRSGYWTGRYVDFRCEVGDSVELLFPVPEYSQEFALPGRPDLVLKHSVVDEDSGGGLDVPRSTKETPAAAVDEIMKPVRYKLTYRGNTVVDIAPKGTIYPLYERDQMRRGQAPMAPYNRYVPNAELFNWH